MCWLAVESVNKTSCLGRLSGFSDSMHERRCTQVYVDKEEGIEFRRTNTQEQL